MTEFPWHNKYPQEVPKEIDPNKYGSLLDFLDDCVDRFGDKPAFENMGVELTFKELDEQSTALANYLAQKTSLKKGDRIALQMPNVLQYPISLFGVLKAGMIVVNTNPQYKPSEMEHQFNDSEAKGIIILSTFAFKLEEVLQHCSVKEVVIAEVGDMLGTIKGAIVDFMVKRVKKMVPDYNLPGAINFGDALKEGKKLNYKNTPNWL